MFLCFHFLIANTPSLSDETLKPFRIGKAIVNVRRKGVSYIRNEGLKRKEAMKEMKATERKIEKFQKKCGKRFASKVEVDRHLEKLH